MFKDGSHHPTPTSRALSGGRRWPRPRRVRPSLSATFQSCTPLSRNRRNGTDNATRPKRTVEIGVVRVMRNLTVSLFFAACVSFAGPVWAQAVLLDEGSFVVEIGGRAIGTESFRIRRSGFGDNAQVIAQGTLEIAGDAGRQTIQSALGTVGIGMTLDAYQVKVTGAGELQVLLQRRGDRLVAETTSDAGVEEREYRRPSTRRPTIILDRFMAHHYFFLGPYQNLGESSVSIVRPRPGGQTEGVLRMASVEPLSVGDRTLQAQRLQLVLEGAIHELWLDSQNRVLRVEIPGEDYVAARLAPPS